MASTIAAVIVGLSLPVVGELGVALAVSAYSQAQRRQRMTDAQTQLADGVRMQIGEAVATLDPTKIRGQVERAATQVTRAIVDATVSDMLKELAASNVKVLEDSDVKFTVVDVENFTPSDSIKFSTSTTGKAPSNKVQSRRIKLIGMLKEFDGQSSEDLNKAELARQLNVSRPTLVSDINALIADQQLSLNGHVKIN